jgi:hypothetical protein
MRKLALLKEIEKQLIRIAAVDYKEYMKEHPRSKKTPNDPLFQEQPAKKQNSPKPVSRAEKSKQKAQKWIDAHNKLRHKAVGEHQKVIQDAGGDHNKMLDGVAALAKKVGDPDILRQHVNIIRDSHHPKQHQLYGESPIYPKGVADKALDILHNHIKALDYWNSPEFKAYQKQDREENPHRYK